jgi:hypothetical protein
MRRLVDEFDSDQPSEVFVVGKVSIRKKEAYLEQGRHEKPGQSFDCRDL